MSNKFDPIEEAKIQPSQKKKEAPKKEEAKPQVAAAEVVPPIPAAPEPSRKHLEPHFRKYRVKSPAHVVVGHQTTKLGVGQIISFDGYGEQGMKDLLAQNLDLEELP